MTMCKNSTDGNCSGLNGTTIAGGATNAFLADHAQFKTIRLDRYDAVNGIGAVTLFSGSECQNHTAMFFADASDLGWQGYTTDDLVANHFQDNWFGSIMIP
jgi:hypothetical protein